uniref:COP9 signalosome subunit 8 n=1 Tax=Ovis aries TaxID=9940 RepID=A0AC11AVF6_SHEEP
MTQRNQRGACAGALGGALGFYVIAGATPLGTEWGPVLLRRRDGEPTGKMPVAVMAESSFSFRKLLDQCENQELEAPGGIATPPVYGQLLALYLLHNDMQTLNLGGSGQLASGSGRGTSLGSTAPSTLISGLRPSSQSWRLSEMQPGDEPSPWSPKPTPQSSPTISQPLLDFRWRRL